MVVSKVTTTDREEENSDSNEEASIAVTKEGVTTSCFKSPSGGSRGDGSCKKRTRLKILCPNWIPR